MTLDFRWARLLFDDFASGLALACFPRDRVALFQFLGHYFFSVIRRKTYERLDRSAQDILLEPRKQDDFLHSRHALHRSASSTD